MKRFAGRLIAVMVLGLLLYYANGCATKSPDEQADEVVAYFLIMDDAE